MIFYLQVMLKFFIYLLLSYYVTASEFTCLAKLAKPYWYYLHERRYLRLLEW